MTSRVSRARAHLADRIKRDANELLHEAAVVSSKDFTDFVAEHEVVDRKKTSRHDDEKRHTLLIVVHSLRSPSQVAARDEIQAYPDEPHPTRCDRRANRKVST